MAIEKDQFGFRVTSQASLLASQGKDWFESASNSAVQSLCNCNPGRASNVIDDVEKATGWVNKRNRLKSQDDNHSAYVQSVGQSNEYGKETGPRTRKVKGILPTVTRNWIISNLVQDWVRAGNDPDDLQPPDEVTPETLASVWGFQTGSPGWLRHINEKLGGLESEAAIALRQWAGRPLTCAQAELERTVETKAQLESAVKKHVGKAIQSLNEFQSLASKTSWDSDERVYRIRHALAELKSVIIDSEE